jgi:hypothetical protein
VSTAQRQRVAEARQLSRLRDLRQEQARRLHALAERAEAEALRAKQRSEAEVASQRLARADLLQRAVAQAPQLLRFTDCTVARQEALDEQLERAEYALLDDEDALEQAHQAVQEARARWRAAQARSNAAQDVLLRAQRDDLRARDHRAEREDPPPTATAHRSFM